MQLRQLLACGMAALMMMAGPLRADDYRLLEIGGFRVKWGEPALGRGAAVTYGFVTAPTVSPGATNCPRLDPPDRLAAAAGIDMKAFAAIAGTAFGLWSGAADIRFRPAAPGETPDILIGAEGQPHKVAFADVWNDRGRARAGVAPLTRATVCLNPTIAWTADAPRPGALDLGTVLSHEIGHAIGLDHPGPTGALMGYRDQGDIDRLMSGDVEGVRRLYGPPKG